MSVAVQHRPVIWRGGAAGLLQWLVAGGVALALHACAIGMLLSIGVSASSEETYGAMALEVGIENVAPSFDASEAAAEVSDAPVATAAVAATEAVAAHEEATPGPRSQSAEADQRLAQPSPHQEDRPEKEEAKPSAAAPAVAGAAVPSRAAERESVQSVARAIGSSAEAQRARAAWRRGLVAHIERQKRYPAGAERSTDIVVSFRIDHHGRLIALEIAKGSGDARYDQAALDMVRRADPMPPPPAEVPDENLKFRIPISFRSGG